MINTVRLLSVALTASYASVALAQVGTQRTYDMGFTTSTPTIDGVVSAGEWDSVAMEGNWTGLYSGTSDLLGYEWGGVWSSEGLYILVTSNQSAYGPATPGGSVNFAGNADSINLYFDPNTDGSSNIASDAEVDGYQVAFQQSAGFIEYRGADTAAGLVNTSGLFSEAHVNSRTGNQGQWVPPGHLESAQINGAGGSVFEMFMAWEDFDASGGDSVAEGLFHNFAPGNGDEWFIAVDAYGASGVNLTVPQWHYTINGFAGRLNGHGEVTFVGALTGDSDLDGDVDTVDITNVISNFTGAGDGSGERARWGLGNFDRDDDIDTVDITVTISGFTGAGGGRVLNNGVPELIYDAATGDVSIDSEGQTIVSFSLQSDNAFQTNFDATQLDADVFDGALPGLIDNTAGVIGWTSGGATGGVGFSGTENDPAFIGALLEAGLTEQQVAAILTQTNWAAPAGGDSGAFELTVVNAVPEPGSLALLGLTSLALLRRRR